MNPDKMYKYPNRSPFGKLYWDTRIHSRLRDDDRVYDCPGCGRLLLSGSTDPEYVRKYAEQLPPVACPKCGPRDD